MRQLGRPALLAAMYSGDGPGAAAAAMAEVEGVLVSSLHELERGSAGTAGASRHGSTVLRRSCRLLCGSSLLGLLYILHTAPMTLASHGSFSHHAFSATFRS